jgi:hypothetical protein
MKDAMKNGNVIDGVQLVKTQSIQIRGGKNEEN